MGATKYQILYRYTNPNSNQFVTNDAQTDYKAVMELYSDQHKIEIGTPDEILSANKEKSELIVNGNSTGNDNYNMLFKFTGTKRFNKKVWKPKSIGYVIRDKDAIRHLTTRAVNGDYTGDYLLMEGDTIDNGIVVAKKNPMTSVINITAANAANGAYFVNQTELRNTIINSTIGKLVSEDFNDYGTLNTWASYNGDSGVSFINIKVTNFATSTISYRPSQYSTATVRNALRDAAYNSILSAGGLAFTEMKIQPSQVETYEIPAHFEEQADYPYAICDTYERIEQSPWFVLSTHESLTSALEKVKAVVKAVGIENVKLVKVVPTDQFVKVN